MKQNNFENFLRSFGASRLLLQRAHDEGFLIEGTILYASLIDGLLRIAIILKTQIENKNDCIDEMLISQKEEGDYYTERQIIKLALKKGVIENALYSKINSLYDERNRIVHRFFLTNIEYSHLPPHLITYELVYQEIFKIVFKLESEQAEKNIGMTRRGGRTTVQDKIRIFADLKKKIDSSGHQTSANTT